jgi:transcription antitermination factor NusG
MGHSPTMEVHESAAASSGSVLVTQSITSESGLDWHVLHTRPRQEKAVAQVLHAAGVRHYLPTIRQVRQYGHRTRITHKPMFPSYLFLQGTRESVWFATSTHRVASVIAVTDQGRLITELEQLRLAQVGLADLDPYPYLKEGRRVRVLSGPFKGVEGLVDVRVRQDRLILKVDALGRAVSLEIDACLLESVD